MWPADQEKQWQIMVAELADAERGLYLATYDRPWTREALWRRLQAEATQRQWGARRISLGAERLASQVVAALAEIPLRLVAVRLDTVQQARWRALNLEREALHDLSVNVLFMIAQETYASFLNSAHDLITWIAPPYSFVLPEFGIPDLPPLSTHARSSLGDRIDYYRDQVRQMVERSQREEAFRLLPPLADLYMQSEMYGVAQQMYQALAVYYDQAADERQARLFIRRRDVAEGWRILADWNMSRVLSHADRAILQRLLDQRDFSVSKTENSYVISDDAGHARPVAVQFLAVLGALSEPVITDVMAISREARSRLRENLVDFFSLEELKTLCRDMQIDFDSLGGEGKAGKVRELIAFLERRGHLSELIAEARCQRPAVNWDDLELVMGRPTALLSKDDNRIALDQVRRALMLLEEEAATYTALTIPVRLRIEIEDKRHEAAELIAHPRGNTSLPTPAAAPPLKPDVAAIPAKQP